MKGKNSGNMELYLDPPLTAAMSFDDYIKFVLRIYESSYHDGSATISKIIVEARNPYGEPLVHELRNRLGPENVIMKLPKIRYEGLI